MASWQVKLSELECLVILENGLLQFGLLDNALLLLFFSRYSSRRSFTFFLYIAGIAGAVLQTLGASYPITALFCSALLSWVYRASPCFRLDSKDLQLLRYCDFTASTWSCRTDGCRLHAVRERKGTHWITGIWGFSFLYFNVILPFVDRWVSESTWMWTVGAVRVNNPPVFTVKGCRYVGSRGISSGVVCLHPAPANSLPLSLNIFFHDNFPLRSFFWPTLSLSLYVCSRCRSLSSKHDQYGSFKMLGAVWYVYTEWGLCFSNLYHILLVAKA